MPDEYQIDCLCETAAGQLVEHDLRHGMPYPTGLLGRYAEEIRPYVLAALAEDVRPCHVPHDAVRRYNAKGN